MFQRLFFIFALMFTFLPLTGVAAEEVTVVPVRLFADSENAGYEVFRAMDNDPRSMWHTQFSARSTIHRYPHSTPCDYDFACGYDHPDADDTIPLPEDVAHTELFGFAEKHSNHPVPPHALGMDLGGVYLLTGFRFTPCPDDFDEPDGNWELYVTPPTAGFCGTYELYVARDADFDEPITVGEFSAEEASIIIDFSEPAEARYVKLVLTSRREGNSHVFIAECQPISEGHRFIAVSGEPARVVLRIPNAPGNPELQERIDEWNLLAGCFETPLYWDAIKDEAASSASLVLPEDRDPLDVLLRRFMAMVEDQGEKWSNLYSEILKGINTIPVEQSDERFQAFCMLCNLRKTNMLKLEVSPLLAEDAPKEYLFIKRHRSRFSHMCDQFYGVNQPPGGGLFVINIETENVRNLLENSVVESGRLKGQKLDKGSFLSPDVSFDGQKIAFAYVECEGPAEHIDTLDVSRGHWDIGRCFHIFTCNADGSELRQITDGTWNDFDPCWLPNGRLAFISERRNGYLRCGRECPTFALYDMNPDGTQMRPLSFHETNEWNPSVTNDGKIIYTRWDYVDRYGCTAQQPWVTTLDGRDPREVHGNYSHRHRRPDAEFDCRAIPDSRKYIAVAGPHHGQSFGSIIMIDPGVADDDAMAPVKRLAPDVGFPESQGGGQVYGTPWPISEKYFLCVADFSLQTGPTTRGFEGSPYKRGNYGIYLCDIHGNRELIYRDPEIACMSPMPLATRPMPHFLPTTYDPMSIEHEPYLGLRPNGRIVNQEADGQIFKSIAQATGTLSLMNVYDSYRPFPEGTKIKELRIIQLLPCSIPSGPLPHEIGIREGSSLDSVNLVRYVLGTVPVEEDGSAYFEMPAQVEFLFQALDENGLAVQSMRSSSYLQPGETLSCIGCHERKSGVAPTIQPIATRRTASTIKPETVSGAYPFSYPLLVQPVLDTHCVDCHANPESNTFSLAKAPIGEGRNKFYASYNNLAEKYGFTSYGDPLRTIPGKYGAHAAPLYKILKDGHYDVKLSDEEMHRIVLWLDCLSNFYGVYEKDGGEAQLCGELAWPTLE